MCFKLLFGNMDNSKKINIMGVIGWAVDVENLLYNLVCKIFGFSFKGCSFKIFYG